MKLQPHQLTFIADELGRRQPPPLRWLVTLTKHASSLVREGAVYGLAQHSASSLYAFGALVLISLTDENMEVRAAAKEGLEP